MTSDAENSRATSGRLEADRLAAAVNAVADLYDPDQIILFGSAARGAAGRRRTPRSAAGSARLSCLLGSRAVVDEHGRTSRMASDSPKGTPHRATSQLPVEPPHGVRRRVVVDAEVFRDGVERHTTGPHLRRLGGDSLVHRDRLGDPELNLKRDLGQGAKPLRTCPIP